MRSTCTPGRGVAVREFPLKPGHGYADYLLYVDGQAVGVIEAKKEGETLTGVEMQAEKYAAGMPDALPAPLPPAALPLPEHRRRDAVHQPPRPRAAQPAGLPLPPARDARRLAQGQPALAPDVGGQPDPARTSPRRCGAPRAMPPVDETGLWPAQIKAVRNLEASLAQDQPRALIQMATGSGKTFTAVTAIYRLIKFGGAKRVLFLVDRANLGRQTLKEFQQYVTPDDGRKFTELYNVQHLTVEHASTRWRGSCITTIQRLYSMLKGEAELDPELEEGSHVRRRSRRSSGSPLPVVYNPAIPIETFDVIFTDECHRSIYYLWRQVLEYFDAYLIGLTATPVEADLRVLQPEPGHGVQPRAGGGRRRERRLRRLPHPHEDHRAGRDGRGRAVRADRQARPPHAADALGAAGRRPDLHRQRARPRRGRRRTRSAPSSARSATSSSPRSSPAAPRCRRP